MASFITITITQDAFAYRAVGIPVSRIFTINPSGELTQELTPNFQTS
jgi:phosphatidate phosphatase LPIN